MNKQSMNFKNISLKITSINSPNTYIDKLDYNSISNTRIQQNVIQQFNKHYDIGNNTPIMNKLRLVFFCKILLEQNIEFVERNLQTYEYRYITS